MPEKKPDDKDSDAHKKDAPDLKDVESGSDADAGPVEDPGNTPGDLTEPNR